MNVTVRFASYRNSSCLRVLYDFEKAPTHLSWASVVHPLGLKVLDLADDHQLGDRRVG